MIDTSNKEIQSHYDFIVVGAGAAGSVLAAELSASGAQVLLVESGGPDDAPTIANPSIWFYNVGGPLDYHLPVNPWPDRSSMNVRWPVHSRPPMNLRRHIERCISNRRSG